jgi:hypothetical protein
MSHSIAALDSTTTYRTRAVARKGLSLTEIALLAVLALALFAAALTVLRPTPTPELNLQPVRVTHGQSLWSLAQQHPVAGCTTAQTVDLIAQKNGLQSSTVAAGAVLLVPTSAPQDTLAMR